MIAGGAIAGLGSGLGSVGSVYLNQQFIEKNRDQLFALRTQLMQDEYAAKFGLYQDTVDYAANMYGYGMRNVNDNVGGTANPGATGDATRSRNAGAEIPPPRNPVLLPTPAANPDAIPLPAGGAGDNVSLTSRDWRPQDEVESESEDTTTTPAATGDRVAIPSSGAIPKRRAPQPPENATASGSETPIEAATSAATPTTETASDSASANPADISSPAITQVAGAVSAPLSATTPTAAPRGASSSATYENSSYPLTRPRTAMLGDSSASTTPAATPRAQPKPTSNRMAPLKPYGPSWEPLVGIVSRTTGKEVPARPPMPRSDLAMSNSLVARPAVDLRALISSPENAHALREYDRLGLADKASLVPEMPDELTTGMSFGEDAKTWNMLYSGGESVLNPRMGPAQVAPTPVPAYQRFVRGPTQAPRQSWADAEQDQAQAEQTSSAPTASGAQPSAGSAKTAKPEDTSP